MKAASAAAECARCVETMSFGSAEEQIPVAFRVEGKGMVDEVGGAVVDAVLQKLQAVTEKKLSHQILQQLKTEVIELVILPMQIHQVSIGGGFTFTEDEL